MQGITLPIEPKAAVGTILKNLSNKRLRDVVERRFGLRGKKMTLDTIGKTYGITRERVRQIENSALKHLTKPETLSYLEPVYKEILAHLERHGGVVEEAAFFNSLARQNQHPHVELLLTLHKNISLAPETDSYKNRWFFERENLNRSEKVLHAVVQKIDAQKILLSQEALHAIVSETYATLVNVKPAKEIVESYVELSKLVKENPYHEYGLISWPTVRPKSIRDKAYAVLVREGKPLHFQAIAVTIDKSGYRGKKKAHPQTVHNELIKDATRFVLVGRGLYGLKDWGYEPGTVKDVIQAVLKQEQKPMTKEMIIEAVKNRRFVKENTILLNLQNKNYFKKQGDGMYFLA